MTRKDEAGPLSQKPARRQSLAVDSTRGTDSGSIRDADIARERDERRRQRTQLAHDMRVARREGIELNRLSGFGGRGSRTTVDGRDLHDLDARDLRELLELVRAVLDGEMEKTSTEDYWHDIGMTLGWPDRVAAGREAA